MCNFNPRNEGRRIDKCLKPLLNWLKEEEDYRVTASCCGHGKYPMTIVVEWIENGVPKYEELLTGTQLPRTKRFYKKDSQGRYYIPEVSRAKI